MFLKFLKVKLHRVKITSTHLDYEGSLTIPESILAESGLRPFEIIDVYNLNNGKRFTTYVIEGSNDREFCVNGAAARLAMPQDRVIIASFQYITADSKEAIRVKILNFDENNFITRIEEKAVFND